MPAGEVNQNEAPLCLITGVGDATGSALARRFAKDGYRVAMIARNQARLKRLESKIDGSRAFVCDVGDPIQLAATLESIRTEMGPVNILIHNAVAHTFARFLEADPSDFERNFRVNAGALLHLGRALAPDMIRAGSGAILVTGNTAAHRGVPNYALFAPTKAAQRVLTESMARELGPKGIHVAYITVDAAIDVTWLGPDAERPSWLVPPEDWPWAREDFFAKPSAIADEVFHVAHQDRSTWSFDHIIRPFAERW